MVTKSLHISGKVQGVFYRVSARDKARELGLNGYVRNLRDGSVEAVVSGPEEVVNDFIRWCADGPPRAKVDNVKVSDMELTEFKGFEIAR